MINDFDQTCYGSTYKYVNKDKCWFESNKLQLQNHNYFTDSECVTPVESIQIEASYNPSINTYSIDRSRNITMPNVFLNGKK